MERTARYLVTVLLAACAHAAKSPGWELVAATSRIRVDVERTEYVHPGAENPNGNCYLRVRVTNISPTTVGVDLRSRGVIYPSCWGVVEPGVPTVIECLEGVETPLDAATRRELEQAFRAHRLAELAPGQALDYYRDFNGTPDGVCDDPNDGKLLEVHLGGTLEVVAGRAEQIGAQRSVRIPVVARWPVIPAGARIIGW